MMLGEKTKELMKQCDELMTNVITNVLDIEDIGEMDDDTVNAIRSTFKMYNAAKELSIYQAEVIDDLSEKIDKLLEQNERLMRLIQPKD